MYLYKTRFDNIVTASVDFKSNALLSVASLDPLRSLIPANVNLDKNIDLVGAAFNAAVVNKFNKNGDGIDTNTAIAFRKYFIHKPTNIEHKKQKVVGHIVNSAFSSFGDNKLLFEDDVKGSLDPFNIALAAVVYRSVNRDFADALVNSNDPESNLFQRISASWEIGFNEYLIAVGSLDLNQAEIITDKKQISEFKKYLKGFDGPGVLNDGTPVYRLVTGRIYPLGIGFTTNPAADVQGVIVDNGTTQTEGENEEMDEPEETDLEESESIVVNSVEYLSNLNKKISQEPAKPVNLTKTKIMDLEQILSALKTVLAEKQEAVTFSEEAVASISAQIAESIKAKNEEFKNQIESAEKAKAEAVAQAEKVRSDLDQALAKLSELETSVKVKAAQETFNSRMSVLDQEYDFDDSDRTVLAKELNSLEGTDEAFASYKEKVAVLFKHKSKAFKSEQEKIFQERLEAELAKRLQTAKPSTEAVASTVELETALANAKVEQPAIPAQSIEVTESKVSWKEKLSKAFSKDNVIIKY